MIASRQTMRSRRTQTLYPWLITAGAVVLGVLVALFDARASDYSVGPLWLLGLITVGFVLAEAVVLRMEFGKQTMTASVVEIALVIAFFELSPLGVLVARLAATLVIQAYRTRDWAKFAFNVALGLASTAVAAAVTTPFQPLHFTRPSNWLVVGAAIFVGFIVSYVGVAAVISVVQGLIPPRQLVRMTQFLVIGLICEVVGIVILLALHVTVWSVILLLGLTAVCLIGYKAYARFLARHESLEKLYELTQSIRATSSESKLADALLGRMRRLIHAEYATLWLRQAGRYPELLLTAREGVHGLLDLAGVPQEIRDRTMAEDRTVAIGPRSGEQDERDGLREAGVKDAIIVPLRSGAAVIGCLEVANRLGDLDTFDDEDVRLLETIAAQTGIAVDNARLLDRLRFDLYHDRLTSLPNRQQMAAAINEAVQVGAPAEVVGLLVFDVDGQQEVNESLGHAAGDQLLAEVGRRLSDRAPAGALVARIGGDEFGMLLRSANVEAVVATARELRTALQDPMPFGKSRLDVDTAVGVAVHPDHGSDAEALLQRADLATKSAKGSQAPVQVFNLGLESRSVRRLGLANDLRKAIEAGELQVFFQPKVAIGRRELVGMECLARWKHSTHGWVSPEDFIPVAEHTGQLGRLTDLVLREALGRCRQWYEGGHALGVAVNLSPRTLADPGFVGYLEDLLAACQVPADRLTLEITEDGMLAESDRSMPTLQRLRALGVQLSVDDFGTGYSSLSYLRRLPVQEVKIDRSFVQGMATDEGDHAIVRAVVDLSRHFGLAVVAEGVESELALEQLAEIGCDVGQGFYFSRPLSYERMAAWMVARTALLPEAADADQRLRIVT